MILAIYPFISLALFLLSCAQFLNLVACRFKQRGFTKLQKWLQAWTILCLGLHIVAGYLDLRLAYSAGHVEQENIVPPKSYVQFAYLNHGLLRVISILCLNIAVCTVEDVDSPIDSNGGSMQSAIYIYTYLRCVPLLFFDFYISVEPGFKTVIVEVFLASEAVLLCVLYTLVSRHTATLKNRSGDAISSGRCFINTMLDQLIFYCHVFAFAFFLESALRICSVIVATSPKSLVLSIAADLCNVMKIVLQLLVVEGIGGLLFLDIRTRDDIVQRFISGISSIRKSGLGFFRFKPDCRDSDNEQGEA